MNHNLYRLITAIVLVVTGCTMYRPMPLESEREWKRLESIRLQNLVTIPRDGEAIIDEKVASFIYSDGLSIDEAAGLAVILNPELRAFRMEKGIARGQLVEAGLLPNPEINSKWLTTISPTSLAGEVDPLFNLTEALVTRGPKKERAHIRIEEVRWEIVDREWLLAKEARLAFIDLLYWDEAINLNQQEMGVVGETLRIIKARQARGATTELEVVVTEAEVAEKEVQGKRIAGKRKQSLQRLNQLLGLPPYHHTHIQKSKNPLSYSPIHGDIDTLTQRLYARLPDLLAAVQAYQGAEKELQIAYRKRFPLVRLGPAYEKEEGEDSLGLGFSLEIPLNRNRGEIAIKSAERDQKRRLYISRLHEARGELYRVWAERETLDDELKYYFSEIAPKLDRGMELTEKAFRAGQLDILRVLVLQRRILESKREILKKLRDFHRLQVEVKRAAGSEDFDRVNEHKEGDE